MYSGLELICQKLSELKENYGLNFPPFLTSNITVEIVFPLQERRRLKKGIFK